MELITKYLQVPIIVLVDEYDLIVNDACSQFDNYKDVDKLVKFLQRFFDATFKSNKERGFKAGMIVGVTNLLRNQLISGSTIHENSLRQDSFLGATLANSKK